MTSRLAEDCQSSPPWRPLSGYLRQLFGRPLRKVPLDPGFGCPGRCSFCLQEAFVPGDARLGGPVGAQLDRALARNPELAGGCLAYLQAGSATHSSPARFAEAVEEVFRRPAVKGLFIGTRPDLLAPEHLEALAPWEGRRLLWLELGLPSANDATLERVGRGHPAAAFSAALRLARRHSLPVCAHVILGLPGEGEAEMMSTADFLARERVEGVKLHQLQVLRGTPLEEEWKGGRVEGLTAGRYAALAGAFLARLPPGTVVHRLAARAPERLLLSPRWGEGAAVKEAVAREARRRRGQPGGGDAPR